MTDEPAGAHPKLTDEVEAFASKLMRTFHDVLGRDVPVQVFVGEDDGGVRHVTVSQVEDEGAPLYIGGDLVFRLLLSYRCEWNEAQEYFAVAKSNFVIMFEGRPEPFLHFDYIRKAGALIPVAHVNVHAHRDEAIFAMMLATKKRGKKRSKSTNAGTVPAVADLHIPLGGHRFRPALEDVLDMLQLEFGVEVAVGAAKAIEDGREDFRRTQLRAAVTTTRRQPPTCYAVAAIKSSHRTPFLHLGQIGYDVSSRPPDRLASPHVPATSCAAAAPPRRLRLPRGWWSRAGARTGHS